VKRERATPGQKGTSSRPGLRPHPQLPSGEGKGGSALDATVSCKRIRAKIKSKRSGMIELKKKRKKTPRAAESGISENQHGREERDGDRKGEKGKSNKKSKSRDNQVIKSSGS